MGLKRTPAPAGNLSPLNCPPGEAAGKCRSPLFCGGGLGGFGGAFLLVRAAGLGLFLRGFLLVGFRRFVAHNVLKLRVDSPAAWNFLRRESQDACRCGHCKWRKQCIRQRGRAGGRERLARTFRSRRNFRPASGRGESLILAERNFIWPFPANLQSLLPWARCRWPALTGVWIGRDARWLS